MAALLVTGCAVLSAQPSVHLWEDTYYPRHNFTFGAGAGMPRGDLKRYFVTKPGIEIGYGYRFYRYFQADVGFDMVFGAADVQAYLNTSLGPLRIKDRQYFVPFGGRAILPIVGGRLLISGGGGGAYMRYSEVLHQPSDYYHVDCPVCTSRDGWGYYALVDVSVFVDRAKHFRVGAVTKSYRGHTQGNGLAGLPPVETSDRWINVLGQVGFSF